MRTPCVSILALTAIAASGSAHAENTFLTKSKPIWESSLRSEQVTQAGFANDAEALTWRNRIGWESGEAHGISVLIEADSVHAFTGRYNSGLNGRTAYPGVTDPEVTEINRAQVRWAPSKQTAVTLGRQRIVLDDGRFVGNSGWRQDEQTFDGARFDTAKGKASLTAAYVSRVNRVVGDEKDWNSDSWLLNASYAFNPALKLTGFVYALQFESDADAPTTADINNARASSVNIAGLRATGSRKAGNVTWGYIAQHARESDAGDNPQDFTLDETMVEVSAAWKLFTARVNFERLGGNGTVGFITPINSAHPFQGFADAFSGTGGHQAFANGIDDLTLNVSVNVPVKFKPVISLYYHDYNSVRLNQDLGKELDIVAQAALTPKLSVMLKHADFDRGISAAPASRTKTWIMLQYKL